MSRLSRNDDAVLVDHARVALLAGLGNVTAPASLTSAAGAVTLTYTTGNPSITPDGAVVIANGASVTAAENHHSLVELDDKASKMRADVSALRTALSSLISTGVRGGLSLAAQTAGSASTTNRLIGVTYTTGDPTITPDNAITIANGGSVTAAELHQGFVELNKEAFLLWQDVGRVHYVVKQICDAKSFEGLSALAAMVSSATMLAITYTTGNPSITPDAALTISNGGTVTAAENWHLIVELKDQFEKIRADLLSCYTALNTFLTKAGVA